MLHIINLYEICAWRIKARCRLASVCLAALISRKTQVVPQATVFLRLQYMTHQYRTFVNCEGQTNNKKQQDSYDVVQVCVQQY